MTLFEIVDVKNFMSLLLVGETFDEFCLMEMEIKTFFHSTISGKSNHQWWSEEEKTENPYLCLEYARWKEMKPYAYQLIKGKKTPTFIKCTFQKRQEAQSAEGKCLLHVKYENNQLSIITGVSMNSFSLDKSFEFQWDQECKEFLKKNKIPFC